MTRLLTGQGRGPLPRDRGEELPGTAAFARGREVPVRGEVYGWVRDLRTTLLPELATLVRLR